MSTEQQVLPITSTKTVDVFIAPNGNEGGVLEPRHDIFYCVIDATLLSSPMTSLPMTPASVSNEPF